MVNSKDQMGDNIEDTLDRVKVFCMPLIFALHNDDSRKNSYQISKYLISLEDLIPKLEKEALIKVVPYIMLPFNLFLDRMASQTTTNEFCKISLAEKTKVLQCIELVVNRCGKRFIEVDHSIYCKTLSNLIAIMSFEINEKIEKKKETSASTEDYLTAILLCVKSLFSCFRGNGRRSNVNTGTKAAGGFGDIQLESEMDIVNCSLLDTSSSGLSDNNNSINNLDISDTWINIINSIVSAIDGGLIAQCIHFSLEVYSKDKNRDIKMIAISLIDSLLHFIPVPELWISFYPGIFSSLYKGITGDNKQGSKLMINALYLLVSVTTLIVPDELSNSVTNEVVTINNDKNEKLMMKTNINSFNLLKEIQKNVEEKQIQSLDKKVKRGDDNFSLKGVNIPAKMAQKISVEWLDVLSQKFEALLPRLLAFCRQQKHYKTRSAVIYSAIKLLANCSNVLFYKRKNQPIDSLTTGFGVVDVIVSLQWDDMPEVSKLARKGLVYIGKEHSQIFENIDLNERLVELIEALPSVVVGTDELRKKANIDLVAGYLLLLQNDLSLTFDLDMEKIIAAMAKVIEFDDKHVSMQILDTKGKGNLLQRNISSSNDSIIHENMNNSNTSSSNKGYYRKSFKHIRNEVSSTAINRLIGLFGQGADCYMLVDYLLSRLRLKSLKMKFNSKSYLKWARTRLPLIYFMKEYINGAATGIFQDTEGEGKQIGKSHIARVIKYMMESIMEGNIWNLPTSNEIGKDENINNNNNDKENANRNLIESSNNDNLTKSNSSKHALSVEALDYNAHIISLLLEIFGDAAEIMGREYFNPLLMHVLYLTLEKVGDHHPVVRQAAMATLFRFSTSLGYCSVKGLLNENMDYVVDSLCARLRVPVYIDPVLPAVMEALLRLSGATITMALMRDLTKSMFNVIDTQTTSVASNPKQIYSFVCVLHTMVESIEIPGLINNNENESKYKLDSARDKNNDSKLMLHDSDNNSNCDSNNNDKGDQLKDAKISICNETLFAQDYWASKLINDFKSDEKKKGQPQDDTGEENRAREQITDIKEIEKLFNEAIEERELNSNEKSQQEAEEEEKELEEEEEKVILEILDRCTHFFAFPSLQIQFKVLKIFQGGLRKLSPKRTILLPAVHKMWPALMSRARLNIRQRGGDWENQLIASVHLFTGILETVMIIAELCGDYFSSKFIEEFWPILKELLKGYTAVRDTKKVKQLRSLQILSRKDTVRQSLITCNIAQEFQNNPIHTKFQMCFLSFLNQMCSLSSCVRFTIPLVSDIAYTCVHFLRDDIDSDVQDQATKLFKNLTVLDGDSFWMLLYSKQDKIYTKNVTFILQYMNEAKELQPMESINPPVY